MLEGREVPAGWAPEASALLGLDAPSTARPSVPERASTLLVLPAYTKPHLGTVSERTGRCKYFYV